MIVEWLIKNFLLNIKQKTITVLIIISYMMDVYALIHMCRFLKETANWLHTGFFIHSWNPANNN